MSTNTWWQMSTNSLLTANYRLLSWSWIYADITLFTFNIVDKRRRCWLNVQIVGWILVNNLLQQNILTVHRHFCWILTDTLLTCDWIFTDNFLSVNKRTIRIKCDQYLLLMLTNVKVYFWSCDQMIQYTILLATLGAKSVKTDKLNTSWSRACSHAFQP